MAVAILYAGRIVAGITGATGAVAGAGQAEWHFLIPDACGLCMTGRRFTTS